MALFKGDVLIAGTNPSGGGGAGGGHVIQDSTGEEFEQRPALQFIGADVVDDDILRSHLLGRLGHGYLLLYAARLHDLQGRKTIPRRFHSVAVRLEQTLQQ